MRPCIRPAVVALYAAPALALLAIAPAQAQITYDAANHAYFVGGGSNNVINSDISGNEVFVGKDNATRFSTLSGTALTIANGASISSYGNTAYPVGGANPRNYYGVNVFGTDALSVTGGSVSQATGYDNSMTNISGGTVNQANGYNTSTTNISGGSVLITFGNDTSTTSISGGTVTRAVDNGSGTMNVSAGSVSYVYGNAGGTTNISGGSVGDLYGNATSITNVGGGTVSNLYGYNASTTNVTGGRVQTALVRDSGTANISGGHIFQYQFSQTSTTNISGAAEISVLYGAATSTTNMSGGRFSLTNGSNDSTFNITGGSCHFIVARDNSTYNISGGTYDPSEDSHRFDDSGFYLYDNTVFNFTGSNLTLTYVGTGVDNYVGTGTDSVYSHTGNYTQYALSGVLADGSILAGFGLFDYDGGYQVGNTAGSAPVYFNGQPATVSGAGAAPEPGSIAYVFLAGVSALGIVVRSRKLDNRARFFVDGNPFTLGSPLLTGLFAQ